MTRDTPGFIRRDPAEADSSLNLYRYCRQRPDQRTLIHPDWRGRQLNPGHAILAHGCFQGGTLSHIPGTSESALSETGPHAASYSQPQSRPRGHNRRAKDAATP